MPNIVQKDTSLPNLRGQLANTNVSPWMNNPQFVEGYSVVRSFQGIRGRVAHVYRDTDTGNEIICYGKPNRTVI